MEFRAYLEILEREGSLTRRDEPLSAHLEAARACREAGRRPVVLEDVGGWAVASNVVATPALLAAGLGLAPADLPAAFDRALAGPVAPAVSDGPAPCQEVVLADPDLTTLPILRHYAEEGGPFVTAGVCVVQDATLGRNASYHRLMAASPRRFTARLVEGRGTDRAYRRAGSGLEAAVCIGPPVEVLLAAAASVPPDLDELSLANALGPVELVPCKTLSLAVPATSEWVFEGRFLPETGPEGPFVDITCTLDGVRQQPVFEVQCVTHRKSPLYHAVLPGGGEHQVLMGTPRELAVRRAVSAVADVAGFRLTAGGCAWLEGVLALRPGGSAAKEDIVEAVLGAHGSLKTLILVDDDVNPASPEAVAWALATRFQPARDLTVLKETPSSSLDPSASHPPGRRAVGSKMVLDARTPPGAGRDAAKYRRICPFP